MCGIAGIIAPEARSYQKNLQLMVDKLQHRGPDGLGTLFFDNCALGHTRLSIVDLSSGQQPMLSATSTTAVTFNGEIYGYQSIKASLDNYPFRTTSDTEVILALYQRYGKGLLAHLPGMFAFAIWDEDNQELFCARDRFGEKPLFYAFGTQGELLFASEIKAILASGLVKPVLNQDALVHYLKRMYVHPYQSIYQNIYTLPPAHLLCYRKGQLSVERYWHLPETSNDIELAEAIEEFKRLFDQAVSQQLVADVPVGAFLSGGLDSSTVVAVASRHQAKLKTFSFGFENSINELPFARQVAELYQTEHIELTDRRADIGELLMTMQDVYDEPVADSSNIPTYLISKLARQYVKVVLTGNGGDELLAGYLLGYKPLLEMNQEAQDYLGFTYVIGLALRWLSQAGLSLQTWQHQIIGRMYQRYYGSVPETYAALNEYFTDSQINQLGLKHTSERLISLKNYRSNTVDDTLRMDLEDFMPGDILVKEDRASMANGLEMRSPFLDVDFASFCISLPFRLKITRESDKLILRQAFAEAWPPAIRTRGKQGFGAPVKQWMQQDSLRELTETYLKDPKQKLFSLLSFNGTQRVLNYSISKTNKKWILLVLALWMDKHEGDLV